MCVYGEELVLVLFFVKIKCITGPSYLTTNILICCLCCSSKNWIKANFPIVSSVNNQKNRKIFRQYLWIVLYNTMKDATIQFSLQPFHTHWNNKSQSVSPEGKSFIWFVCRKLLCVQWTVYIYILTDEWNSSNWDWDATKFLYQMRLFREDNKMWRREFGKKCTSELKWLYIIQKSSIEA